MKPGPRALLLELARIYNGSNNGRLALGRRAAAERICVSKRDTATSYFRELEEKGFIRTTRMGAFSMKDPTSRRTNEYRLTWWPTDGGHRATKDFLKWKSDENLRSR